MAIYRGKGGATQVEPAPGDTEFAGSIIVSGDILDKGNLLVEEDLLANGTITSDGGFIGDGSELTNLPSVWKDNGSSIEFNGNGGSDTEVWAVNNGKKAQMTILSNGLTYFTGDGPTYFGTGADEVVKIITNGTAQLAVSSNSVYSFQPVTAPSFIGDGSQLTGLPPSGIPEAPVDGLQYGRQSAEWTQIEGDGVWSVSELTGDAVYDGNIDVQSVESNNDITVGPYKLNPAYGMRIGHGSGGALDYLGNPVPISSNVAIGYDTLAGGNQTKNYGVNITAIGSNALKVNEGGKNNTAVGYNSLAENIGGQNNTAIGMGSAQRNVTGYSNTSVGTTSLLSNTEGTENTAIGHESLYQNTGAKNTALGTKAGNGIQSGSNNTVLGFDAEASSSSVSNEVTLGNADVTKVRVGNGDVIYPAPAPDSYTKTESDAIDNAQDVKIQNNANAIATLPSADDFYTKGEIDLQQGAQDNLIIFNNDEINRQQIEITNNTASIDKNDGDINTNITNIASNTTAIGTLSGQVGQNSEDIAELQNSIFFSSAYSAEYPSAPNRDPEDGNMYLQNVALFTYSYAAATQIFVSKTDESGNVRQFTAVQPGDSIVLNEVNSPNYGRYELDTIEEVSDSYVVMNVIPKLGQGTVITGAKIAFQAFPKVGLWDENESNGYGTYPNNLEINGGVDVGSAANGKLSNTMLGRNASGQNAGASAINNVSIGDNAFAKMSGAKDSVAVGSQAMKSMVSGSNNTAIGSRALSLNAAGKSNVAIGAYAGATLAGGDNNILIGDNAAPSAPTVNNEITLGNSDTTVLRMGNGDIVYPASGGGGEVQEAVVMQGTISSGSYGVTPNVWVPITIDSTEYDTNDCLDTATGRYIPNVEGYYLVNSATSVMGTDLTRAINAISLNGTRVVNGSSQYDGATPYATIDSRGTTIVYCNGTTDYISMELLANGTAITLKKNTGTQFNVSLITGQSTGGSGGGSYTPEAMVWEDVVAERAFDTVYTNTNDVPIYVQVYSNNTAPTYTQMYIDGSVFGAIGVNADVSYNTNLFIVPSGSTYELRLAGGTSSGISVWNEARMPVAVGTGGKTVAFRGNLSAKQTGLTTATWTKINLNTTSIDTDNALVDGKFKPSVAGYYQVNGGVREFCSPVSNLTVASIYKNGLLVTVGSYGVMDESTNGSVNDIIYLDGNEDYIELFGQVVSSGTCGIESPSKDTYLSAVLVSGGSASGDSVWTEPNDSTTLYESDNATVTQVRIKSGDSASQIVQYATGQSYFKGDGPTYFGNNSDSPVQITQNNVTMLTATADGIDIPQDLTVNGVKVGQGGGDIASNTSVGTSSLLANTTGNLNSAFGGGSLQKNTTGIQNTAVGYASLQQNEYGVKNTAVGFNALQSTQYKDNQTAVGNNALKDNKQSGNTAVGSAALDEVVTGANNTAIGSGAGQKTELGNNNTLLGYDAQPSATGVSNEVTIGNDDVVTMRSHGGKYSWNNGISYTMAQQTSKDGNSFLRTKVYDDGVTNFEVGGTFNIVSPSVLSLQSNSTETLRLRSDNTATFRSSLDVEGNLNVSTMFETDLAQPNLYWNTENGAFYRSTYVTYSTQEVDEMLAKKDKLIEKLSERLDSLELKFKALK